MVFLKNCPTNRSRRMHLKTIFNRVTDYKPFVVDRVELVEDSLSQPTIEISMRARENGLPTCSGCGCRCSGYVGMKESYDEELATHIGLDPYADDGDVVGVASARGTDRLSILSSEILTFVRRPLWCHGEGNTFGGVMASDQAARRSRRTKACLETPNARTGRSHRFPHSIRGVFTKMGNGQKTSQAVQLI